MGDEGGRRGLNPHFVLSFSGVGRSSAGAALQLEMEMDDIIDAPILFVTCEWQGQGMVSKVAFLPLSKSDFLNYKSFYVAINSLNGPSRMRKQGGLE